MCEWPGYVRCKSVRVCVKASVPQYNSTTLSGLDDLESPFLLVLKLNLYNHMSSERLYYHYFVFFIDFIDLCSYIYIFTCLVSDSIISIFECVSDSTNFLNSFVITGDKVE